MSLPRRLNDVAMLAAALGASVHAAFLLSSLGDYPHDAGPAIAPLLRGNLHAFALARPAMGDVSLLLRAPFAALAGGSATGLAAYRWGSLPCVLAVAALALWLARIARRRGTGALGAWMIVLIALVNPLVTAALSTGHPEELLTTSLCIGAFVAAFEGRQLLTAVLLGLALASKQWAVITILPVLFVLERGRVRALAWALALAVLATLPELLGAPIGFLKNQLSLAPGNGRTPSVVSWWWPLAPNTSFPVRVAGDYVTVTEHRLPLAIVRASHSLIIAVDVLLAVIVAHVRRVPLRRDDGFALLGIIFLLRCTLDPASNSYYHAPLFFDLLAWDALRGERIPLRALVAAAVSYVLFERLTPNVIGDTATSVMYVAITVVALTLLVRTLARRAPGASRSLRPRVALTS